MSTTVEIKDDQKFSFLVIGRDRKGRAATVKNIVLGTMPLSLGEIIPGDTPTSFWFISNGTVGSQIVNVDATDEFDVQLPSTTMLINVSESVAGVAVSIDFVVLDPVAIE